MATGAPGGEFRGELRLSADLRDQLGLRPEEAVRVGYTGGHTIVLERTGGEPRSTLAVPWDRALVLAADVRAFAMADVLSLLHGSGKSGFLLFSAADHEKSVTLSRGEVVFAASTQQGDRLGECLLRAGAIGLAELREAERRLTPTSRMGRMLVDRGVITPRELWNGVKLQIEEIVRSLFSYTAGRVQFWEGEVQPDNVVRLSLPTRRLISEGLRRRDELLRFVAALEAPCVSFTRLGPADVELGASQRLLLAAIERGGSFQALCRESGLDPLSAARTIQLLVLMGAVRVDRGGEPAGLGDPALRSGDEDGLRAYVRNHVKLLAELAAPIVAVEGAEGMRSRLESVIAETASRFPELLARLPVGRGAVLDPDELARRALRLPGDRQRAVSLALGELVAYLEFELMNHPRIEEPEHFLEALDGLRSQIAY